MRTTAPARPGVPDDELAPYELAPYEIAHAAWFVRFFITTGIAVLAAMTAGGSISWLALGCETLRTLTLLDAGLLAISPVLAVWGLRQARRLEHDPRPKDLEQARLTCRGPGDAPRRPHEELARWQRRAVPLAVAGVVLSFALPFGLPLRAALGV